MHKHFKYIYPIVAQCVELFGMIIKKQLKKFVL